MLSFGEQLPNTHTPRKRPTNMETVVKLEPADTETQGNLEWSMACCKESGTLRNLLEDLEGVLGSIPIPEVNRIALASIGDIVTRYLAAINSDPVSMQYFEALRNRWQLRQQPSSADLLDVGRPPARPQWLQDQLAAIDVTGPMALFDVLLGGNYLDIPMVTLAVSHFIADKVTAINNFTPDLEAKLTQLRELFQVENDFDPEEYERIKQEHGWCLAAQGADPVVPTETGV